MKFNLEVRMLKPVREHDASYMHFADISRYAEGVGRCFCYSAQIKRTKAGKPFVTLHLRDVDGATLPGYIFDLASPLLAGKESLAVVGQIVEITWNENYLEKLGMTVTIDKVFVVTDVSPSDRALFCGAVDNLEDKRNALQQFFVRELNCNVTFPPQVATYSSPDYVQGRVGGLYEHYYRMYKILDSCGVRDGEMRSDLVATFVIYIYVHSAYTRANDSGEADINLVNTMMSQVSGLAAKLNVGDSAMELVHMFFGYEPKGIHVRTVSAVADLVQRLDKEFALYKTIPLMQEGNAGYGAIKRYKVEKGK